MGVYSLRAKRERPFVSMPVSWVELKKALNTGDAASLYWEPSAALERLEEAGDLFAPVLKKKQRLRPEFVDLLADFERKRDGAPSKARKRVSKNRKTGQPFV